MKLDHNQILSEVIKYYEDFDGYLEESLFNWLIERVKKADQYELIKQAFFNDNFTVDDYLRVSSNLFDEKEIPLRKEYRE